MAEIFQLPGTVQSKELLEELKRMLPEMIEYVQVMATLHKAKYDALIKAGFNDPQAIELCKIITQS